MSTKVACYTCGSEEWKRRQANIPVCDQCFRHIERLREVSEKKKEGRT